jgi:hypothetical protein
LDRISIARDVAIENGHAEPALSPINAEEGVITPRTEDLTIVGEHAKVSLSLSCADLKPILEETAPRGERYFGLFRSALLSTSPAEEFMHLYHILMMFFGDVQERLDEFIRREEPGVPVTHYQPRNVDETVYRRLRNEFGHERQDGNLDKTKAEMKKHLSGLIVLTKRAIESRS